MTYETRRFGRIGLVGLERGVAALVCGAGLALALVGCSSGGATLEAGQVSEVDDGYADSADDVEVLEAPMTELERVVLEDGTVYTFSRDEQTGGVGVLIRAPDGLSDEHPRLTSSVVALFEELTGHAASDALVAAERRARETMELAAEVDSVLSAYAGSSEGSPDVETHSEVSTVQQALTAAEFSHRYCDHRGIAPNPDFLYCFSQIWGSPWAQVYSYLLAGALDIRTCWTSFRYRYYWNGQWWTPISRREGPGSYWLYYYYGWTSSKRWEVVNNPSSCMVRFSAWGLY